MSTTTIKPIKVANWIEQNRPNFQPPICNKLMYENQLKVFFVGGPNQRDDYHIEEGEEFFYMLKGDMSLKIVECGVHKTIHIREGEVFLLPSRIPHSPQRKENTMGLVIEREREKEELDGLRYYVPGTKQILYQRWFYCSDLGKELGPIIKSYFASPEYKTGIPSSNSKLVEAPFEDDSKTRTIEPFSLTKWLQSYEEEIEVLGHRALFDESKFATNAAIYGGDFNHFIDNNHYETYLWQLNKNAKLEFGNCKTNLENGSSIVVPPKNKILLQTQSGSYTLVLSMPVKYIEN